MNKTLKITAEQIRKLEVQGARNVAIAALKSIQALAEETKAKDKNALLIELKEAQEMLFATRETEPLMRNAICYIIIQAEECKTEKVDALRQIVSSNVNLFLQNLDASRETTAEIGAKRIRSGMLVFTHCHSSTVTRLLGKEKLTARSLALYALKLGLLFKGEKQLRNW